MKTITHYKDLGSTFEILAEGHSMDFSIYEGFENFDGAIIYQLEGSSSDEVTTDLALAQTLLKGYVKFDGCSHVHFGDDGYIHICGISQWEKMSKIIEKITELSKQYLNEQT